METALKPIVLDALAGEPQTKTLTPQQQKESSDAAGAFAGAILICIVLFSILYAGKQLFLGMRRWWASK